MKKILNLSGYLGMMIFIITVFLGKVLHINEKEEVILIITSFIMFIPMLVWEIKNIILMK